MATRDTISLCLESIPHSRSALRVNKVETFINNAKKKEWKNWNFGSPQNTNREERT